MNLPTEHSIKVEVDEIIRLKFIGIMRMYSRHFYDKNYVSSVWETLADKLPHLKVGLLITKEDYIITIDKWDGVWD